MGYICIWIIVVGLNWCVKIICLGWIVKYYLYGDEIKKLLLNKN